MEIASNLNRWLDKQVSLYRTQADNYGRPATYREIIFSPCKKDIATICELRKFEREYESGNLSEQDYKIGRVKIKRKLQCFTPAALLECKASGQVIEKIGPV